jgi:hypothetical protein
VQSHLGEPLRARVTLIDPPRDLQADCFSVRDGHDASLPGLVGTRVTLDMRSATLHITSKKTVNDPVLQISVTAQCQTTLQRDYVLLLDPPQAIDTATVPDAAAPAANSAATAPVVHSAIAHSAIASTATTAPAAQRHHPRRAPRVTASAHRAQPPQPARVSESQSGAQPGGARLIVSGVHDSAIPARQSRADATPESDSQRELQEDSTALNHHLADLEAELAALQKQNAALDRARLLRATPSPVAKPPVAAPSLSLWPRYLIGVALLVFGVILAWRLRRLVTRTASAKVERMAPLQATRIVSTPAEDAAASPMPSQPAPDHDTLATPTPLPFNAPRFQISNAGTEVNEGILDQAEVYMAHGHSSLAIHLLQEHLRESPTESPVPWLLLLDLLKRDGLDAEYRETSLACQGHFNVNLSAPPVAAPTPDGGSLEAYPHVVAQLQSLWGTPAAGTFLTDLVYDHRGGTRLGFDSGTYREIVLLRTMVLAFAEAESATRARQL